MYTGIRAPGEDVSSLGWRESFLGVLSAGSSLPLVIWSLLFEGKAAGAGASRLRVWLCHNSRGPSVDEVAGVTWRRSAPPSTSTKPAGSRRS